MKTSHTALLPQLSLWELPALQESIEEYSETQIRPLSVLTSVDPVRFNISSASNEYILLNECELYIQIKVCPVFKEKTVLTADTWNSIIMSNNLMHSLFKKLTLYINNQEVTDDSTNCAFKALFESILGWSGDSKKTDLATALFDYSSADRLAFCKKHLSSDFKVLTLSLGGTLHLDLALQKKALIGGCNLTIELEPNKVEFYIHNTNDNVTEIKVEFLDAVFYAHKVEVSRELELAHREAILRAPARYPYTRNEVRSYTVPPNMTSYSIDNVFRGTLPRRIFIAVVDEKSLSGNYKTDSMQFKPADLTRLVVYYDGQQIPNIAYTPSFKTKNAVREYRGLLKASNQNHFQTDFGYTYTDWLECPLYGFNFNADLSSGAGSHICPAKTGQINIKADFGAAFTSPLAILVFGQFDRLLEIDQFGQVSQS